jgi:hypothetical protein
LTILNFPRTPQQRIDDIRFTCSCCGAGKRGEMMDLIKLKPDIVFLVPTEEWGERVRISSDLCSVDDAHFLVRTVLEIPIRDTDKTFAFGAWGSLSRENFKTYERELYNPAPAFGPFFSFLASSLMPYPDIYEVEPRAAMHFRPAKRPLLVLDRCDHPLALDQHEGITVNKVAEIYAAWGHTTLL